MESKLIPTLSGKLHVLDWEVEKPKALLLIVHGYAEHGERYDHVAKYFNNANYTVKAFDLRGHGKSEGKRAFIKDFDYYLNDLEVILKEITKDHPDVPKFILGHSMGGLIVALAATKSMLNDFPNVILSNPAIDIVSNQPKVLVSLVRFLAKVLPKMPTTKLDSQFISRDPEVVRKYDNDPLVYRGGSIPKMVDQFDKAGQWMKENADQFQHTILLCYSKSDKTVFPQASEDFYNTISSKDKKIKEYPGLYHELLNEPEQEEVMNDILDWCNSKM
jgi:alpha-beta hydrolase superfamily lysophospholipase